MLDCNTADGVSVTVVLGCRHFPLFWTVDMVVVAVLWMDQRACNVSFLVDILLVVEALYTLAVVVNSLCCSGVVYTAHNALSLAGMLRRTVALCEHLVVVVGSNESSLVADRHMIVSPVGMTQGLCRKHFVTVG